MIGALGNALSRTANGVGAIFSPVEMVKSFERTAPAAVSMANADALSPVRGSDRVALALSAGIWHVRLDGAFWGDFHQKEDALAAMARANLPDFR